VIACVIGSISTRMFSEGLIINATICERRGEGEEEKEGNSRMSVVCQTGSWKRLLGIF
jgi:hypothetical protein